MTTVTVPGATGHNTVSLTFNGAQNAAIAQQLAKIITAGQKSGSLVGEQQTYWSAPTTPPGHSGVLYNNLVGFFNLPSSYSALVDTAPSVYYGNGHTGDAILSDASAFGYFTAGGSGTVVGGDGVNVIVDNGNSKGWEISVGNGTNEIKTGNGSDTVYTGTGSNTIYAGSGALSVTSGGHDVIHVGSGPTTIHATATAGDQVFGGTGKLTFTSQGDGSVVYAGTGHATLTAGSGRDYFMAQGANSQTLIASSGNTTLNGADATGSDTFVLGGGKALVALGTGKDTVVAGSGKATIFAGSGHDVFSFIDGEAAGVERILGFTSVDKLRLTGYGSAAVAKAVATQTHGQGGTTITLSDNTKIVLVGVSSVSSGNFG